MFRLLFQFVGMTKPEWTDSENIENLRKEREEMLRKADNNNIRFIISPIITDITVDKDVNKVALW